jgi:hypothetical protein
MRVHLSSVYNSVGYRFHNITMHLDAKMENWEFACFDDKTSIEE